MEKLLSVLISAAMPSASRIAPMILLLRHASVEGVAPTTISASFPRASMRSTCSMSGGGSGSSSGASAIARRALIRDFFLPVAFVMAR